MIQLRKKIFIQGEIKLLTGTMIGGTNNQMGIGGLDKSIIRDPLTQLPIIPGSSLKGKMRALLELSKGKYKSGGDVGNDPAITCLFGTSAAENENSHASRLIVRDAKLIVDENDKRWDNTDLLYSEAKTEVVINRLTSKATPRTNERVPAGAKFNYEMIINIVCEEQNVKEEEEKLCKLLAEGIKLLEEDYIGANGSRGYGQIKFINTKIKVKNYPGNNSFEDDPSEISEHFDDFKNE
ncbi:MAG: CRISPR-associated protein Csm3 [Bacteroidia bacterium]|nr:MAG: CRISPR-associated protein Csm3 [Bacteroidia bacterium]